MMPRREFVIRVLALGFVLGASVFVAVRAAVARDGATGSARSFVTVAGTVTKLPGDPREVAMRFAFHRVGGVALCAPVVDPVQVAPGGAFSAQVPLDAAGFVCPADLLDGRDVEVDVDIGALSLVRNAKINPVPYAHFATTAGGATGPLETRIATLESTVPWSRLTGVPTWPLPSGTIVRTQVLRWFPVAGENAATVTSSDWTTLTRRLVHGGYLSFEAPALGLTRRYRLAIHDAAHVSPSVATRGCIEYRVASTSAGGAATTAMPSPNDSNFDTTYINRWYSAPFGFSDTLMPAAVQARTRPDVCPGAISGWLWAVDLLVEDVVP